jgi:hypothetical protein
VIEIKLHLTPEVTFEHVADFVQACQDTFDYEPKNVSIYMDEVDDVPIVCATKKVEE